MLTTYGFVLRNLIQSIYTVDHVFDVSIYVVARTCFSPAFVIWLVLSTALASAHDSFSHLCETFEVLEIFRALIVWMALLSELC